MNKLMVFVVALAAAGCGTPGPGDGGSGGGAGGSGGSGGSGGKALVKLSLGTFTRPDGGTDVVRGAHPRYSPDSARLAYLRTEGSADLVAVMAADGTGSQTLATDASYLTGFAWRSDGTEVLYSGTSVKWLSADGGTKRPVFSGGLAGFASMDPDLSPDGKTLVYGVNGGNLKLVDLSAATPAEVDLGVAGRSPRFSPDGGTLAFNSGGTVTLLDLASRQQTALFNANDYFASVDWFKDGLHLVAGTDQGLELVTVGPPVSRVKLYDSFATLGVESRRTRSPSRDR